MKENSVFRMYWKAHWKEYGFTIAILGIFELLFFLYDLQAEVVHYGCILTLALFLVWKVAELPRFLRKHRSLQTQMQNLPQLTADFPKPATLAEQDLTVLFCQLHKMLLQSQTEWENREQNALDFYTTWVHQIKTPISVMKMMLQREDTKENRAMSAELFRMEQYVEMVLSYLRLDSDQSDFLFRTYDLDEILRGSIRKYAPQFIAKKIKLSYDGTSVKVLTDEKWLSFLVEQILSNSLKYTREGSITISVSEGKLLSIADTGIGIAPEDLPRIFEKGFTGYNGRSDKKATGLGLYLCKRTAEKLGHQIWAESVVGQGTTVFLNLNSTKLPVE